jgi:hypothetical protein
LLCGGLLFDALVPVFADEAHYEDRNQYLAPRAAEAPVIDGVANEPVWQAAEWHEINHLWLGPEYSAEDFSGRFKVSWTEQRIYILVEVVDDILFDSHRDPLVQYWDDDCVEIFIDEDYSGGDHQYNHSTRITPAVTINTTTTPSRITCHSTTRRSTWARTNGRTTTHIMSKAVGSNQATRSSGIDGSVDNEPVTLHAGKVMGLMLAYCDNDGSELRENFVGSESVPSGPKDRGWIDAGLFGTLQLVDTE